MKTLFLFRDSYDAKYIVNKMKDRNLDFKLILETGVVAKRKKLRNYFKRLNIIHYPLGLVNIASLILYSSYYSNRMKQKLGSYYYPEHAIALTVDDANDTKCIDFINKYKPDVIIIYGTSILRKYFLESIKSTILNIHSGIVPYYRNVHSDFWAFLNDDSKNIGISIMYVDAGVDTGDVFLKKRLQQEFTKSLTEIKIKNLELIVDIIPNVINKIKKHSVKRLKQNNSNANNYNTPTLKDILKLINK